MCFYSKKGQSLLEYSVLFAVILSALAIMQSYVKRGYQGRLKQEADAVGSQYSPGHTTSSILTAASSTTTTRTANGVTVITVNPAKSSVNKSERVDVLSKD